MQVDLVAGLDGSAGGTELGVDVLACTLLGGQGHEGACTLVGYRGMGTGWRAREGVGLNGRGIWNILEALKSWTAMVRELPERGARSYRAQGS